MRNLVIMLLGLFLFCSCSSSDSFENVDVNNVMSEESLQEDQLVSVQSQIESLNQEMFTSSNETRGFWKFFTKIVCTVFADAVGGLVGAGLSGGNPVVAASTAVSASGLVAFANNDKLSFNAHVKTNKKKKNGIIDLGMNHDTLSINATLIPQESKYKQFVTINDSIGYYHNVVLKDLSLSLASNDIQVDTLISKVALTTSKYYQTPVNDILVALKNKRSFFDGLLYIKGTAMEKCNNLHDLVTLFKMQNKGLNKEFDVLEEFFKGLVNVEVVDNNGEFMNRALIIVDKSSLDEITKNNLRNAFIVGNASYQLWNTEN